MWQHARAYGFRECKGEVRPARPPLHRRLYLEKRDDSKFPTWTAKVLAYRLEVCPANLI